MTLRSAFSPPSSASPQAFVIDTTGELATWIDHADAVIIGKSFLSTGGQNPAEAILARKPVAEKVTVKHVLLGWSDTHATDPRGEKRTRAELEYRSLSDVVADLPHEMERLQRTCALATQAVTRRYFAGSEARTWQGISE